MANWKEYTTKTTPEDADEIMIADSKANASKRTPFSGLWNWIANKLATAVISQLETQNKSIIPALNELNSKPFMIRLPVSVSLQDTIATISIDIADAERGVIILTGRFGGEIYFSSIINYGSTWDVKQVVFAGSNTIKNEQNKKVLTITSAKAISSKYEVNALLIK